MQDVIQQIGRRNFFTSATVGTLAAIAGSSKLHASELTNNEQDNVKLVNDFCAVWRAPMNLADITEFLAEDCIYRASETAPAETGHEAITNLLQQFVAEATFCEFEVVDTFARGSIVVNERWDRFQLPTRRIEWHGVGVFYMKDKKILEWSDFTIL